MISFEESMKILDSLDVETVGVEKIFLTEALKRFLAQEITATQNNPEFLTAAMDGFAIRAQDQEKGVLKIVGSTPAGSEVEKALEKGEAIKTFTGSLMPKGADTLIPIENVEVSGNKLIIKEPVEEGFSVREVGENYKKGETLIKKGTKIGFAEIGVMASLNIPWVKVYQKPKVAILSTGSELLEVGECQISDAQIYSSNNYTLEALAKAHGAKVIQLGIVKDEKESITNTLKMALKSCDLIVSTGGVSVGDYDFVKDVIRDELGCNVAFKGVIIKPGQHVMVAQKGNRFIVALPGFAYSSTITFLLYALPLLYRLQGGKFQPTMVYATLKEPFIKRSKKTEFTPCNLTLVDGEYFVDFQGKRSGSSAIMTNMLDNAALVVTKPDERNKEAGERVLVWILQ